MFPVVLRSQCLMYAPPMQGGVGADDDAQWDDDDGQRLFSMYVHDKPGSPDYGSGDVYFGHRIAQRVEVRV